MSKEEKYFAFIEHNGKIELVHWTKTEELAKKTVESWKDLDKKQHHEDHDIHYYVGQILF